MFKSFLTSCLQLQVPMFHFHVSFSFFFFSQESFSKEKQRLLSTQASIQGSTNDPNSVVSLPPDSQLWKQIVGEKKGRVYGMGSQAHTMWSAVHDTGGSSSQIEISEMKQQMRTLQDSVNFLILQLGARQLSPMQQPPMPYPPWMPPPPSQVPPPPHRPKCLPHRLKCLPHHPKCLPHIIILGCSLLLGNTRCSLLLDNTQPQHFLGCNHHIQLLGHLIIIQESHHRHGHRIKTLCMKMLLR